MPQFPSQKQGRWRPADIVRHPSTNARLEKRGRIVLVVAGAVAGIALGLIAINFMPATDVGITQQGVDVSVIDGDTIRVNGQKPDVRLIGFNAPETRRAACAAENELGEKATRRLREIVQAGNLDLQFSACSCLPGTEGTKACNFGRKCGALRSNGRDVGDILISEKLAVPYRCGATSCPTAPRPWCR